MAGGATEATTGVGLETERETSALVIAITKLGSAISPNLASCLSPPTTELKFKHNRANADGSSTSCLSNESNCVRKE